MTNRPTSSSRTRGTATVRKRAMSHAILSWIKPSGVGHDGIMQVADRRNGIERRFEVRGINWAAAVCAAAFMSGALAAEDASKEELKRDAVSRVVEAHDVALPVYIGRVYVKQAALAAARDLLAQKGKAAGLDRKKWNMESPQWRGAEAELMQGTDALIQRKVASGYWVQEAWSEQISTILNGEEADEIAVHFRSEGGELQRRVIEWF